MHRTILLTLASDNLQRYTLNVTKVQHKLRVASGLKLPWKYGMEYAVEVWNGIRKKILVWNGKFLV